MAPLRKLRRRYLGFLPDTDSRRRWRDRWLRRTGLARTREPAVLVDHPSWRVTNLLRYVAAEHLLRHGRLHFLQIGAYDGELLDDMRAVIELGQVRGVLVEPQPEPFARLSDRHGDSPHLTLVNAAIDRVAGTRTLYTTRGGDALTASFHRRHLLKHGAAVRDIVEQQVTCLTISDVLRQGQLEHLDLLQVDAEGHDYEILKSFDFETFSPAIVRFECSHLSRRDLNACVRMLAAHGYRFLFEKNDVTAVRQQPAVQPAEGSSEVAPAKLQVA